MHRRSEIRPIVAFFFFMMALCLLSSCRKDEITQDTPRTLEASTEFPVSTDVRPTRTFALDRPDSVRETSAAEATQRALFTPTPSPSSTPTHEPSPTPENQITPVLTITPGEGPQKMLQPNQGAILRLAYSSDGSRITIVTSKAVLTYQDGEVHLEWQWPFSVEENEIALSQDGSLVAVPAFSKDENGIEIWDVNAQKRMGLLQFDRQAWIESPTFSLDGQRLAASVGDSEIAIWEVNTGRLVSVLRPTNPTWQYYQELAFSWDRENLAAGFGENLHFWDLNNYQEKEFEMECRGETLFDMEYSPDGEILVYSCGPGYIYVGFITFWNVEDEVWEHFWHEGKSTRSLAYEPDGSYIALGYFDGRIALWSEASGYISLLAHGVPRDHPWIPYDSEDKVVNALAFSPSGKYLVSGSEDGSVILWDLTNLKPGKSSPTCELYEGQTVQVREDTRVWS